MTNPITQRKEEIKKEFVCYVCNKGFNSFLSKEGVEVINVVPRQEYLYGLELCKDCAKKWKRIKDRENKSYEEIKKEILRIK